MCICACVFVCEFQRDSPVGDNCKQLSSNQSFDRQIYSHQKGGGVSTLGEWVRKATAYKFDTCTLIGVHSTMHLMDPITVHVSYTCVCACVRTCVCVCVCVCVSPHQRPSSCTEVGLM